MALTLYWYPNCSTCKKAKKLLDEHNKTYKLIHLVEETPTSEEIKNVIETSKIEPKKFFNTSGKVYREENMKEKIKNATLDEMASSLASNGMLMKRPIVTDGQKVTVGLKEEDFKSIWL
jgi:arsenate reductase